MSRSLSRVVLGLLPALGVFAGCASSPTLRSTQGGAGSSREVTAPPLQSENMATQVATGAAAKPALPAVRGFTLTVSDVDRSVAFFRGLDFVFEDEAEFSGKALDALLRTSDARARVARLHLGMESVELRGFTPSSGRSIPRDARSNDAIFQHMAIVVGDMDAAFARVVALGGVTLSAPPQTIPASNPVAGGIRAAYFLDPDRHDLEVIWFPRGKGNPRWQSATGTFLGIDHSAIAVADTDQSERFYEALGFSVAGRSLNSGKEQEALSGVGGARVRITGLAARQGPAVEFLSYLAPGPGAPAPRDAAATDIWHWEVTVEVADLERALESAQRNGGKRFSERGVDVRELALGYSKAALVTDRDGHCLRLVQK